MQILLRRALALALPLLVTLGCATLGEIPTGVCGNHIVEIDEACESTDVPGTHCGGPNETGACRYTCGVDSSAGTPDKPQRFACPPTYGCGIDEVCRRLALPAGDKEVFKAVSGPVASLAVSLNAGDFDGDGRGDVLGVGPSAIEVIGLLSENALTQKSVISSDPKDPKPSIGVFQTSSQDDRPRSDFATVRPGGFVSVWRGQTDGSITPTFYSAFASTGPFRIATGEVVPEGSDSDYHGDEVLSITSATDPPTLSFIDPKGGLGSRTLLANKNMRPEDLAPVRTGRIDETLPCDHVVIGIASPGNDRGVMVFPLCRRTGKDRFEPNDETGAKQVPPFTISLPAGSAVGKRGLFVIDVDGDGHLDVVIDGGTNTMVSYGFGDGTFHSVSGPKPTTPDFSASPLAGVACKVNDPRVFPLAMGYLTRGDKKMDFVTGRGICYTTDTTQTFVSIPINEAVIGDVNGNGLDDVIAATDLAIEVFSSTGAFGNRFTYPATRPKNLAVGDFDGDLLTDVAFEETADGATDPLSVMFGRPFSGPESPIIIGAVSRSEQIVAGTINPFGATADDLTDLGVISAAGPSSHRVAFIRGSTDRQLEAPFAVGHVSSQTGSRRAEALAVAAGRFLGGDYDALAVLARSGTASSGSALWLVPVGVDGQVDDRTMKETDPFTSDPLIVIDAAHPAQQTANMRLAAINLDASSQAELVIVTPPSSESNGSIGHLWVARVVDGAFAPLASYELGQTRPNPRLPMEIYSGDFDGDGNIDVAVRVERSVGVDGIEIKVLFGKGDGTFDDKNAPSLPKAFAATTANIRGETRLLVAHRDGVSPVSFKDRQATLDPPLVELGGRRPEGIVATDVDGDGVVDLVVADNNHVTVYTGVPELP